MTFYEVISQLVPLFF